MEISNKLKELGEDGTDLRMEGTHTYITQAKEKF